MFIIVMMTNQASLNPASIVLTLGAVAFFLILASLAGQLAPYFTERNDPVSLFSVDSEQNIPTFFSVLLLLFAALLLSIIAVFKRKQRASYALHWAVLSFGFLFMAVDEATSIHEKLNEPMSALLGEERPGIFYFAWVVPGMALALAIGLFFLKFLLHLPARTKFFFLAAAALYLGGVIVVELVGNHYAALDGTESWTYILSVTVEESLEMGGIIVFIFALLQYMAETYGEMRFQFNDSILQDSRFSERLKTVAIPLNPDSATSPSSPAGDLAQSGRSNRSHGYMDTRR